MKSDAMDPFMEPSLLTRVISLGVSRSPLSLDDRLNILAARTFSTELRAGLAAAGGVEPGFVESVDVRSFIGPVGGDDGRAASPFGGDLGGAGEAPPLLLVNDLLRRGFCVLDSVSICSYTDSDIRQS